MLLSNVEGHMTFSKGRTISENFQGNPRPNGIAVADTDPKVL